MSLICAVTHRTADAVRKWCPFAFARNNISRGSMSSGNHDLSSHGKINCSEGRVIDSGCLTNRCMAWIDETDYFYGISLGRCGLINLSKL